MIARPCSANCLGYARYGCEMSDSVRSTECGVGIPRCDYGVDTSTQKKSSGSGAMSAMTTFGIKSHRKITLASSEPERVLPQANGANEYPQGVQPLTSEGIEVLFQASRTCRSYSY